MTFFQILSIILAIYFDVFFVFLPDNVVWFLDFFFLLDNLSYFWQKSEKYLQKAILPKIVGPLTPWKTSINYRKNDFIVTTIIEASFLTFFPFKYPLIFWGQNVKQNIFLSNHYNRGLVFDFFSLQIPTYFLGPKCKENIFLSKKH